MDLQFYDFNLNFLKQVPKSNTRWELRYNDVGTFEAAMSYNTPFVADAIERLNSGSFFVVRQGNYTAIIIGYDIQDTAVLYGRTCNWILTKRISKKFAEETFAPQTKARSLVSEAFSDCSNFALGTNISATDTATLAKDNDGTTFDYVKEILSLKNYGHSVSLDLTNKLWKFNITNGVQRDFVRSEANKTAYDARLTYDVLDLADCGYYEKEVTTTDADGNETTSTETTYLKRGSKSGLLRWESLLSGSTEGEALADLKLKKAKDDTAFSTRNIKYGTDYNLGDIFTMQLIKGLYSAPVTRRVTGIEITYNESGYTERPIFEALEE